MHRNRQPKSVTTFTTYEVEASELEKGDTIRVGERSYNVKSNRKVAKTNKRLLTLEWGTRHQDDEVTMTVPGELMFRVKESATIYNR